MKDQWNEEEIKILRENYAYEDFKTMRKLLPLKTSEQIRNKAKLEKIKKIKPRYNELFTCYKCNQTMLFNEDNFFSFKNKIYSICKECRKKISFITNYKSRYGIILDFDLFIDQFDIIQWYRWTIFDKTPNGKLLQQIPCELITEENLGKIARYVINEIIGFKKRTEILQFSQKHMNQYKIGFSKTPFVLNSPHKLLTFAFPELNIKPWELQHSGNKVWRIKEIFLEAVKYYYESLNETEKSNLDLSFSEPYLSDKFCKLQRAKEIHYNHLRWDEILEDIGISYTFKYERRMSYNGIVMRSIEEKIIYDYVHNILGIRSLTYIGNNQKEYRFTHGNGRFYYPDYFIDKIYKENNLIKLNKPIVIEYFGMYEETSKADLIKNYTIKTKDKIKYYNEQNDYVFVFLFPCDYSNLKKLKDKLYEAISKSLLKGGEIIGENALPI